MLHITLLIDHDSSLPHTLQVEYRFWPLIMDFFHILFALQSIKIPFKYKADVEICFHNGTIIFYKSLMKEIEYVIGYVISHSV